MVKGQEGINSKTVSDEESKTIISDAWDQQQSEIRRQIAARPAGATASGNGTEILAGIEDMLDEIDLVIEENAEEYVKFYVQKGGD